MQTMTTTDDLFLDEFDAGFGKVGLTISEDPEGYPITVSFTSVYADTAADARAEGQRLAAVPAGHAKVSVEAFEAAEGRYSVRVWSIDREAGPAEYAKLKTRELETIMDFDASSPEAEKAAAEYGKRQAIIRLEEKAAELLATIEAGDLYRAAWFARGIEDLITGEDATTRDAYGYRLEGDVLTGQRLVKDDGEGEGA